MLLVHHQPVPVHVRESPLEVLTHLPKHAVLGCCCVAPAVRPCREHAPLLRRRQHPNVVDACERDVEGVDRITADVFAPVAESLLKGRQDLGCLPRALRSFRRRKGLQCSAYGFKLLHYCVRLRAEHARSNNVRACKVRACKVERAEGHLHDARHEPSHLPYNGHQRRPQHACKSALPCREACIGQAPRMAKEALSRSELLLSQAGVEQSAVQQLLNTSTEPARRRMSWSACSRLNLVKICMIVISMHRGRMHGG